MTFSLYAAGTHDEALAALTAMTPPDDPMGADLLTLLITYLTPARSEGATASETVRYEITASGSSADGEIMMLTVNAAGRFVDKPPDQP